MNLKFLEDFSLTCHLDKSWSTYNLEESERPNESLSINNFEESERLKGC